MMRNLQKAGLSQVEAKVYIGLLEIGNGKASDISTYTNVATSNLYAVLESLQSKGLVAINFQNNVI